MRLIAKANGVLVEPRCLILDEKPIPEFGRLDAFVRIVTTTIYGADVHNLKGEHHLTPDLTIGQEPLDVIRNLALAMKGFTDRQRLRPLRQPEAFYRSKLTQKKQD